MDAVLAAGIARMTESPATAAQLRDHLAPLYPDRDPAALAHAVRCLLPTIQTPTPRPLEQTRPPHPHHRQPLAPHPSR